MNARFSGYAPILLFFVVVGCGEDGSSGSRPYAGPQQSPPDAGEVDGGERPQVERSVTQELVDDCGDVPVTGRCKDDVTIESCFVPEAVAENASLSIVTVVCDPGEHCVQEDWRTRCEPDSECTSGTTECLDANSLRTCIDGSWQIAPCGACMEGSDLGAECVANAPGVGGVTLRGRLTFEHRVPKADLSGFASTPVVEGAVGLLVHVYDGALIGVGETLTGGEGHTAGEFEIELAATPSSTASVHFYPIDRDPKGKPRLGVAVASQANQSIQLSNAYHGWRTDVCENAEACAGSNIDLGEIRITEQMDAGAIHIFQWLNYGMDQLRLLYPSVPQRSLVAFWSRTNVFDCGACYLGEQQAGAKIFPGGSHVDRYDTSIALSATPAFDDLPSVVTHELGHYVMESYSRPPGVGGKHWINAPSPPHLAWSEGWATFYGQALLSEDLHEPNPIHVSSTKHNQMFWADLEQRKHGVVGQPAKSLPVLNPVGPVDQPINEIVAGSVIWSLWAKGRAATPQGLGDQPIFEALASQRLTQLNRGHEAPDLVDFLDALACADEQLVPDITAVVANAGFPWRPAEALCAP